MDIFERRVKENRSRSNKNNILTAMADECINIICAFLLFAVFVFIQKKNNLIHVWATKWEQNEKIRRRNNK